MKKIGNLFIGFVVIVVGLQIMMTALEPFLPIIGLVLTVGIAVVVLGGLGFVGYAIYKRFNDRVDEQM